MPLYQVSVRRSVENTAATFWLDFDTFSLFHILCMYIQPWSHRTCVILLCATNERKWISTNAFTTVKSVALYVMMEWDFNARRYAVVVQFLSDAFFVAKQLNLLTMFWYHRDANLSRFSTPTVVGRGPHLLKISVQSDCQKCWMRQISARVMLQPWQLAKFSYR